jgi:thiol-disulfide isomerase/thioredoxin
LPLKKQGVILAVIVVLIVIVIFQNTTSKTGAHADQAEVFPKIGFKAPSFTLLSLDGKMYPYPLEESKPAVINFWASWCGPCRLESPELAKLYDKYQGKLEIYAVNLTTQDSANDAQSFADEFGFTFPVLLDSDAKNSVADQYRVLAIPTTFFVNKDGIIVDKVMGLTDPKTLESKFKNLTAAN